MADEKNDQVPVSGAVSANQLRKLAEWADGVRGRNFTIGFDAPQPDGTRGFGLKPLPEGGEVKDSDIAVHTARKVKGKLEPQKIIVHHPMEGVDPIELQVGESDALFWGEASAEKFLVPYYVRFFSDAQMEKLRTAIASESVIAFLHWHPSFLVDIDKTVEPQLIVADAHGFVGGGLISLSDWMP